MLSRALGTTESVTAAARTFETTRMTSRALGPRQAADVCDGGIPEGAQSAGTQRGTGSQRDASVGHLVTGVTLGGKQINKNS